MISPETEKDILAEISHSLASIAKSLETLTDALVREQHVEIFTTNHNL
jgi:hypothetical protein